MTDDGPETREPGRPSVGGRHVLVVALAVAAFVLALQVLSAFIPGLRDALELWPLLIGLMVVVTVFVLYRAVRPRRER
jgi:amino acid permease